MLHPRPSRLFPVLWPLINHRIGLRQPNNCGLAPTLLQAISYQHHHLPPQFQPPLADVELDGLQPGAAGQVLALSRVRLLGAQGLDGL